MKKSILILGIICFSVTSQAQESSDYGLFFGMGQEHDETILPIPTNRIMSLNPAVGGFYRKNFNPRFALRIGAKYGFNTPYYAEMAIQNEYALLASAGMAPAIPALLPIDLHALFEFNFLPLNPKFDKPKVSTFVATGIGIYQLRPVIPFNVGIKYRVTKRFGLSAEWNIRRKVYEVKKPIYMADPASKWFSYIGITANYNILKKCKTCPFYESSIKKKR